ncbi:Methionine gamma-lyase [Planctomycetes bacterium Pan216]|uniref:Methionine gamma-lyase n=1 Tax=Kolteria novifilia TaxID=2527975 RepID=A0A518BBH2_9BACT|nr:Methionine gamma-lyase [Planctomycetes bacterium Pan216]
MTKRSGLSTVSVHAGEQRQKFGDAMTDPIFCTSTYTFETNDDVRAFAEKKTEREEYGRYGSPNERVVERKLAALEGGEAAVLFSSGMAAFVGLLMSKVSAGDNVVFFDECYHRSREFCVKHLSRFGVESRQIPTGDYEALERSIDDRTKMLVSESPTNPHLSVVDLERFIAIARDRNVESMIDATLATPYNLRPLDYGIDYVLHSATKYLGGHNDLLAGVVIGSAEKMESVRYLRGIMGAVNSSMNGFLLQRGLKTFSLRMQQHNQNGATLAEFLHDHPKVERIWYPGLRSHPYHDIARQTMKGFGGLLTFTVKGNAETASRVIDKVEIPRIGPSLGGVESLIEQPMLMSYFNMTPEERAAVGIEDAMIRVSLGIEDTDDLLDDFKTALDAI